MVGVEEPVLLIEVNFLTLLFHYRHRVRDMHNLGLPQVYDEPTTSFTSMLLLITIACNFSGLKLWVA